MWFDQPDHGTASFIAGEISAVTMSVNHDGLHIRSIGRDPAEVFCYHCQLIGLFQFIDGQFNDMRFAG